MPSRRRFLSGVAAGLTATAGCLNAVEGLVGDDSPPAYATWLYDPAAVLPTDRYALATLDVAAVRETRETLPESADDALGRADRLSESVGLGDVDRLTALGYGAPQAGSSGLTLAAEGSFDTDAIRAEIGVDDSHLVTDEGARGEFRLYAYEPSLFGTLREFQGPDQSEPPDLTFALGMTAESLVVGTVLSSEVRGLAAVRAAVDARVSAADDATGGVLGEQYVRDLLVVVGDRELVVGLSRATVADLAARVDDEETRSLLADADGLGFGYALADETLRVALAAAPTDLADPDRVRSILEDSTDDESEDDGQTVERVGVARGGRVVYADLAVPLETVVDAAGTVSADEPLGTATE